MVLNMRTDRQLEMCFIVCHLMMAVGTKQV